jgi:hypothetical protein
MAKIIKKIIKYLTISAGTLAALVFLVIILLLLPSVQTKLAGIFTARFAERFNSTISIGRIDFKFFNRLHIEQLLILDQNSDTLAWAPSITLGIREFRPAARIITLGRVELMDPVIKFITDSSGTSNLRWYLDKIKNPSDSLRPDGASFRINHIDINNARFSLLNDSAKGPGNSAIDFSSMQIKGINAIVENLISENDTSTLSIYNLSFTEKSGFKVKRFVSDMELTRERIKFIDSRIICDSSILNIRSLSISKGPDGSYSSFTDNVRLDIDLDKSLIYSQDLSFFVKSAGQLYETIELSGRVTGTVAELRGRQITARYGQETLLSCDFDFSGLPDIENSFIFLSINELSTIPADLQKLRLPGNKALVLPGFAGQLEKIYFSGSFTGFTTDFVAYGNLRTPAGSIKTDISLRPLEKNTYRVRGLISGNTIQLGSLADNPELLGNVSFSTDVDGLASSLKKFSGSLTGLIDSIEVNNYKYRDIALKGRFSEKTWDGTISLDEENIEGTLLGMFDFSSELPEFDFTLNLVKADLHKLNFDASDTTSSLSALLTANFKGSNIDNLDGEIRLLNSNITKYGNQLELYDFSINAFIENNKPAIRLRTDYFDADLRGYYNFSGLGTLLRTALNASMPSKFPKPEASQGIGDNKFTFSAVFRNTDRLNDFFRTGIYFAPKSTLSGEVNADSLIRISSQSAELNIKNNIFSNFAVEAVYSRPEFNLNLKSSSLGLLGQSGLKDFNINFSTQPDTFGFDLSWDNRETVLNKGSFSAMGRFTKTSPDDKTPLLTINVDSSNIYVRNNLWKINRSIIEFDSAAFSFSGTRISNNEHYYYISGRASEESSDSLSIVFNDIDMSPLNGLGKRNEDDETIPLSIHGTLDGRLKFTGIYRSPLLEANLKVSDFSMLESNYGDLHISSIWNSERNVAEIMAGNNLNGRKMLDVNGFYDPSGRNLNLTMNAEQLPVDALNPLLKVFASDIKGSASGRVRLTGQPDRLVLKGSILAENTSMKIDYLQSRFRINDSIRFDRNSIIFKNLRLTDERGSPATLNGAVNHTYFKNYIPDLTIAFNDCLVLNTRPKDNELFYGTAYATGVTTIKSNRNILSFDISARTGRNTRFNIPLNTSETVAEHSFISFINIDSTLMAEEKRRKEILSQQSQMSMDLNFDLTVTPEAEVQLIFDPTIGDAMKAHGSGNLNLRLDSKGTFRISGDYDIDDGEYLFTLGNILNKPFIVENGGKITFNGDLDNAEIQLKAIYNLRTSLYDLMGDENYRERIPVECQINLSGKLFNPIVSFNIYLPMADEATRSYVRNVINTDEELSRQFLYLLVMNRFYSDPSISNSVSSTSVAGTSAMAVTTTEMISNQISNWLSQISNDFDLGFAYRPGSEINPDEVELALRTQILNDRVTINGNFDVRGTEGSTSNTNQITGDFDIEYTITEKIRFKVFNRFNNPYTGKGVPYTQGFGLFYRQDFDKLSDLFRKRLKSEGKKEEEAGQSDN